MVTNSATPIRDFSDLKRAITEIGNLIHWLDSWPRFDAIRRDAARESFARGEICSDSDLLGST
jgi:hypothetical protein